MFLGSGPRLRTLGSGTFCCPREDGPRRYRLVAVRRWLRMGPVPLIPRVELGRYIECRSCASTFDPDVVHRDDSDPAVQDGLTLILRRAATAVLGSSDSLSSSDRREAVIVLQRYSNVPYSSNDLDADLAEGLDRPLETEFAALATTLNEHGRQAALSAIVQLPTPTSARRKARERITATLLAS